MSRILPIWIATILLVVTVAGASGSEPIGRAEAGDRLAEISATDLAMDLSTDFARGSGLPLWEGDTELSPDSSGVKEPTKKPKKSTSIEPKTIKKSPAKKNLSKKSKSSSSKKMSTKKSTKKKVKPPVELSATFALRFVYDDNFTHYSDDYLDDYGSGRYPHKFSVDTSDDFIVRPRLDLNLKSDRLTGKSLSIRFRYAFWRYNTNGIKNNESYSIRFRHPVAAKRDYLELSLYHAPMAYLRELSDREPYTPGSDPLQWRAFSYSSNSAGLAYWVRLSPRFEIRPKIGRSIRFYNRPFMENDNWEWNFGGNIVYRPHRRVKTTWQYIYSNVRARGADSVWEELDASDDSDPSYERDSFKFTTVFRPRRAIGWARFLSVSAQYQAYYFTSEKTLLDDPYHVGRKDQVYRLEISSESKKFFGSVVFETGYRFTERTSSAPWHGDIAEDKDYTDNRSWFGARYSF